MRTRLAAALAAGSLGLAGLGVSLALPLGASAETSASTSTDSSSTDSSGTDSSSSDSSSSDDSSTSTDSAADDRKAGFVSRILDALEGLVSDGTITQDQAQKVADTLAEQAPAGDGRGGHGMGGHGIGGRIGGADLLATAAETLGVTEDELHTAVEGGSTLADVAADEGVDVQTLVDALVAAQTAAIDQAVTDGNLTSDQAATIKADLETRITEMVNNGFRGGRGGHGPMGGGPMGDGDGDGPDAGTTTDDGSTSSSTESSTESGTDSDAVMSSI